MNVVIIKGNLTADPDIRVINEKTTVANFTVAVSRYFKKRDGTKDKETVFIPCEAWDTGAEQIGKYFVKGDGVLIEGSMKMDQWEKDGAKHSRMKIRVGNFEKLYKSDRPYNNSQPADVAVEAPADEPAPF